MAGTRDLAKYPFLRESAKHVADYDLRRLDENDVVVNRAASRIRTAAMGAFDGSDPELFEIEITTFLTALIMMKKIDIPRLTRKFALAEARRVEDFIYQDLRQVRKSADKGSARELVFEMMQDFFDGQWKPTSERDGLKISMSQYLLRRGFLVKDKSWSLINLPVEHGWVYMHYIEAIPMIRECLYNTIINKLFTMTLPAESDIPYISAKAAELKREIEPQFELKTIHRVLYEYPPCIKHCVTSLDRGDNLPHTGRLLLATYMVGIGKEVEEIVDMFRNAPDFNEQITKQQISSIAVNHQHGQQYHVMGCAKVQMYGYCFPDEGCAHIRNPIQYTGKAPLKMAAGDEVEK